MHNCMFKIKNCVVKVAKKICFKRPELTTQSPAIWGKKIYTGLVNEFLMI